MELRERLPRWRLIASAVYAAFYCVAMAVENVGTVGAKLWEVQISDGAPGGNTPAIGPDGTIYVTTSTGLWAISPDGRTNWMFQTLGGSRIPPPSVASDGTVYFAEPSSKKVYAVGTNGVERWNYRTPTPVEVTPTYGQGGTVCFGDNGGTVYALHPDGRFRWKFIVPTNTALANIPPHRTTVVIGADQTLYFSAGRFLHALTPEGNEQWRFQFESDEAGYGTIPAIDANGTIYAGNHINVTGFNAVSPSGSTNWGRGVQNGPTGFIIDYEGGVFPDPGSTGFASNGVRVFEFAGSGISRIFAALANGSYLASTGNSIIAFRPTGPETISVEWSFPIPDVISGAAPVVGADGTIYLPTWLGRLVAVQGPAPLVNSPWPCLLGGVRHSGQVANAAPDIVIQPRNVSAIANSPVVLSALASGTGPLQYQWLKDGQPLPGATNSVLRFHSVLLSEAGHYRLLVTSGLGTATSQEVTLTVNATMQLNMFAGLSIDGEAGQNCLIEYTTNLDGVGPWSTATNFTLPSHRYLWFDVQSTNQPRRFYRVTLSGATSPEK
jgi:hypothetical protein